MGIEKKINKFFKKKNQLSEKEVEENKNMQAFYMDSILYHLNQENDNQYKRDDLIIYKCFEDDCYKILVGLKDENGQFIFDKEKNIKGKFLYEIFADPKNPTEILIKNKKNLITPSVYSIQEFENVWSCCDAYLKEYLGKN